MMLGAELGLTESKMNEGIHLFPCGLGDILLAIVTDVTPAVGDETGMSLYRRNCPSKVQMSKGTWVQEWQLQASVPGWQEVRKEDGMELSVSFSTGSIKEIK